MSKNGSFKLIGSPRPGQFLLKSIHSQGSHINCNHHLEHQQEASYYHRSHRQFVFESLASSALQPDLNDSVRLNIYHSIYVIRHI